MILHRDRSTHAPRFFPGSCGCNCINVPSMYYYPTSYYYGSSTKLVPDCWGCGQLFLPETLTLTVQKLVSGCTCQTEQSMTLQWYANQSAVLPSGTTYTYTSNSGGNRGIWATPEFDSLCTGYAGSDPTAECKYFYKCRYVIYPGTPDCNGTTLSGFNCRIGLLSKLNLVFGADATCVNTTFWDQGTPTSQTATSCRPLSIFWDFIWMRDFDVGSFLTLRRCTSGCSTTLSNWRITVTE